MLVKCDKEARDLLLAISDGILRGGGRQAIPLFNALEGVIPKENDVLKPEIKPKVKPKAKPKEKPEAK